MRVNTRYINSTRGTSSVLILHEHSGPQSVSGLCQLSSSWVGRTGHCETVLQRIVSTKQQLRWTQETPWDSFTEWTCVNWATAESDARDTVRQFYRVNLCQLSSSWIGRTRHCETVLQSGLGSTEQQFSWATVQLTNCCRLFCSLAVIQSVYIDLALLWSSGWTELSTCMRHVYDKNILMWKWSNKDRGLCEN